MQAFEIAQGDIGFGAAPVVELLTQLGGLGFDDGGSGLFGARDGEIALGADALVLSVDVDGGLGVAGNLDGAGVDGTFLGVGTGEVPANLAARLYREFDAAFAAGEDLALVGEGELVFPTGGFAGFVLAVRVNREKPEDSGIGFVNAIGQAKAGGGDWWDGREMNAALRSGVFGVNFQRGCAGLFLVVALRVDDARFGFGEGALFDVAFVRRAPAAFGFGFSS